MKGLRVFIRNPVRCRTAALPGFRASLIMPGGCTVIHRDLVRPRKSLSPRLGWHFVTGFGSDVEAISAIARENQVSILEAAGLHNFQPVVAARRLNLPLVWQFHSTAAPRPLRVAIGCLASRLAAVVMSTVTVRYPKSITGSISSV